MKNVIELFRAKYTFIIMYSIVGFAALQAPLWQLQGSKTAFTLFDLCGPLAGAFIGAWPGVVAVALVQAINFAVHGARVLDAGTIIRFIPMLFAAWYFGSKNRMLLCVPLVAIIGFVAHPIGRTVWYFAFLWTIPLFCYYARDRFVFARALGATFTAHAVGGVLWIYTFHLPAAAWASLIPAVLRERMVFALGITLSYFVFNNILQALEKYSPFYIGWQIERGLVLKWLR